MSGAEMVAGNSSQPAAANGPAVNPNDPMRNFLAHVMGQTEAVWTAVLPAQTGVKYRARDPRHL